MTVVPSNRAQYDVKTWAIGSNPWQQIPALSGPKARVIIDNDFSGDPDDLFQVVHHLLSANVDIRAVIGSHLRHGDPFDNSESTADNAVEVLYDVFARMGLTSTDLIVRGSNHPLSSRTTPQPSAAVDRIIEEALREVETPLFYVAGGGLTDLASALLIEPKIANKIQLIWIGGEEHLGLAYPPPNAMPIEYNLLIDLVAGQVVFNDSEISIWQVPRNVYRQCLVSDAELRIRVAAQGPLGEYLYKEVQNVTQFTIEEGNAPGETYALGDSPLVLLTVLRSLFEADPSSSFYVEKPTPELDGNGSYIERTDSRSMRVYTQVDVRLMFEDFYLKLHEFSTWQASS